MSKNNEEENLNYLLDPQISVEEVNKLFFEGDIVKLYKLSKNVKFKEIDEDVFLSMSKTKVPFYQNNDYQTILVIGLLILSLFFNGVKEITNISLLVLLVYLLWQSKDYKKKLIKLEQERLIHIQKILKGTEYSVDEFIDESIWNTGEPE